MNDKSRVSPALTNSSAPTTTQSVADSADGDRAGEPSKNGASPENEKRICGYHPWRPQTKTRILLEQVQEVIDTYADYLPLTLRQIFYALVGNYGYPKTDNAYDGLTDKLARARRARLLPFDVIRDDGIAMYQAPWYGGVQDFWDEKGQEIRSYRRDRQAGQEQQLELWCEAGGMAPQLARVATDYSVPVYTKGGYASLTAVRDIVRRAADANVHTVLLHVGDYDPSGENIFASIVQDAAAFLEEDRRLWLQRITGVRVALTAEQVSAYSLPTAPAKTSDTRSRKWAGEGTCQLEALPPDELARIVRAAIAEWVDMDRLQDQIALEAQDISALRLQLPRGPS